mgnify:CR=1 FL=1
MYRLSGLDPRTKIIMVIAISTGAMTVANILYLSGLFAATVVILAAGGVSLGRQLYQVRGILGMIGFLFVLQWIFGGMDGLVLAAMLSVRLLIIVMSALILLTGEPRDYLLGMTQWKMPYEIAFMVMTGLHFFPILKEEALDIYYSIQLRGTEMKKTSLKKKLKTYLKISLPILAGAMERAKDTSVAMEARCFRLMPQRTYMRRLRLKARDICVMIIVPAAVTVFILGGCGKIGYQAIEKPDQIMLSWTGDPAGTQTVSWHGDSRYDGIVECNGKDFDASVKQVLNDGYYRYSAEITGLKAGKTYKYRVGDGRTWSSYHSFTTEKSGNFEFMYMGDIQYELMDRDYKKWGRMADLAYEKNPDTAFILLGGDMVENNAALDEYGTVIKYGQPMFSSVSVMPTPGNHETSIAPYTYEKIFSLPLNGPDSVKEEVYSFDYGDCHIVSLNSNLFLPERINDMGTEKWKAMMEKVNEWLEKDLSESDAKWKVVFMHQPPYPVEEDCDVYGLIRENWVPVFEKEGVDLVFCGHQHVYMRTKNIDGITYIMARSGEKYSRYYKSGDTVPDYVKVLKETNSYEMIYVKKKSLEVRAFDASGKQIDSWEKQ